MGFFGKKKSKVKIDLETISPEKKMEVSYLGKNINIKGNISGHDDIQIDGKFEGNLKLKGSLNIQQTAKIKGSAMAKTIYVKGEVEGKLAAGSKIFIDQTARIKGEMFTPVMSIVEGAKINGAIKMID